MNETWHGHSAFRIEAGEAKILIDPFLSDNPSRDNEWSGYLTIRHRYTTQRAAIKSVALLFQVLPAQRNSYTRKLPRSSAFVAGFVITGA
jgi:L-ascorbate metabolism protein UlaG (beta-lactamase superfamily)